MTLQNRIEKHVKIGHTREDAERLVALSDRAHGAETDYEFRAALDRIAEINRKLDA